MFLCFVMIGIKLNMPWYYWLFLVLAWVVRIEEEQKEVIDR